MFLFYYVSGKRLWNKIKIIDKISYSLGNENLLLVLLHLFQRKRDLSLIELWVIIRT